MSKVKGMNNLQRRRLLIEKFKAFRRLNENEYDRNKKQEQPMIDAIQELGHKIEQVTSENKNLIKELVPVAVHNLDYPRTPTETSFEKKLFARQDSDDDERYNANDERSNAGAERYNASDERYNASVQGVLPLTNYRTTIIGEKITQYLNNCDDHVFGLRPEGAKRFIGDSEVDFKDEALIIKGTIYGATDGLMKLLTRKDVSESDYKSSD